jgi:hypothetical protein
VQSIACTSKGYEFQKRSPQPRWTWPEKPEGRAIGGYSNRARFRSILIGVPQFVSQMLDTVLAQAGRQRRITMTTLKMKLTPSERLLREAVRREAVRRQALRQFLAVSGQVAAKGVKPLSLDQIQREVNAVRKARRAAGR